MGGREWVDVYILDPIIEFAESNYLTVIMWRKIMFLYVQIYG